MADRSIVVRLRAEVAGFKQAMAEATNATERTAKGAEETAKRASTALGRMVQSAQENREAWNTAGATLTGFGAATLGALGFATKAAMDWESAWAGVQKTVSGTAPEMEALEAGLRGMARELPASHTEIAAVAEAAGQLGIATPNVLGFTRTMIDMGEATNLSAEEAATSLARFMNVMGTSQGDVGRLGASIVGLGNNFATTEAEIVAMSQRLSGAGAQANLTEGDVLGIATAMSSVGIEAEAGGSAMSMTMKRIGKSVDEGGDSLDLFAQVAGMSAEQFSEAWRTDPAMALDAFVTGLSHVESQGMTTNGVLTELGITGIRESDSLLRLSAASQAGADGMSLLGRAVQMGNDEFDRGMALVEEANKRYETAESRVRMAKNAFVDAAISIGGTFLPAVSHGADALSEFAGYFADLPAPMHAVIGGLAGVTGAATLAGGAFLLTFPRVMDTVSAFKTLREISPPLASSLGRVGKAAGVAAAAFVTLSAAAAVSEMFSETAVSSEEMSSKLANLSATAVITAADINDMVAITGTGGAQVRDFGYALDSVNMGGFMKALDSAGSAFGLFDSDLSLAKEQIASLDQALSTFAMAGTMDYLEESFRAAVDAAAEYGYTAEDVIAQLPGLRTALEPIATDMGLTADNTTLAKIALQEITPEMYAGAGGAEELANGMAMVEGETESASDAIDGMVESLSGIADAFLSARDAARKYEDATKAAKEAVKENGKHWEDGTKAARENAEAIDDMASSMIDTAERMNEKGEATGEWLKEQREDLVKVAIQMGATREEAEEYVNSLGLFPDDIETIIELDTQYAKEQWAELWAELGYSPPQVPVGADTTGAEEEVELFKGTVGTTPLEVPVTADTSGAQEEVTIWGSQAGDVPAKVYVEADTYYAEDDLRRYVESVNGAGGTVEINGEPMTVQAALDTLVEEINRGEGTVMLNGNPVPGEGALLYLVEAINKSGGTVEIDGDAGKAWNETTAAVTFADGSTGTITITGDNGRANSATDSAKRHADGTTGTIDVNANASGANAAIDHAARNRTAWINVQTSGLSALTAGLQHAGVGRAGGGPIYGAGTGTSDSVPIWASAGEHMLTAAEVALAGGHDSVYRMRAAIRAGELRFATGGGISADGAVRPSASSWAYGAAPAARGSGAPAAPAVLTLEGSALSALSDAVRTGASQASITVGERGAATIVRMGERAGRR